MVSGKEIREARERAGLTQEALGALVGVSMRTIGNWERGATVPLNRLAKIREVLAGHWKDDESRDRVGLSNATDVELLAEIARRFARTTETRAGDGDVERDPAPNRPAGGDPAGTIDLDHERNQRDRRPFGHRGLGDLDHQNTGPLVPPPAREEADAAYDAPNRGAKERDKQDRSAEDRNGE